MFIKQIWNWLIPKSKYLIALFVIGLAFCAGFFICKHYDQNVVTVTETIEVEKPVVKEVKVPVEVKGDTVIRYVEKQSPSDSDVEITHPAPVISVDYNGTKTELAGVATESQKFDKGKLQVEQKTETVLDVTPIVEREVNTAVAKAVRDNTDKLNESHTEDMKKERHKRHRREVQAFLTGAGVGLLAVAF